MSQFTSTTRIKNTGTYEKIPKEKGCVTMEPIKIGVGGPVGAGKTMLIEKLTRALHEEVNMAVITNDIYTKEDAKILVENGVLAEDSIDRKSTRMNYSHVGISYAV